MKDRRPEVSPPAAAPVLRFFHGQADALFLLVHLQNPHRDHISHGKQLGGVLHPLGQLADVDQPILMDPDVHKCPEVDDVAHRPL